MKKKTKIISSVLGATTLGGGIAVATIAQACGTPDPSPTPIPDPDAAFRETIIAGVNSLSIFNRTNTPTNSLALSIIAALSTEVGSEILTLNFANITTSNISESNNIYTTTINTVNGNIINGETFSGNNIVLSITVPTAPVVAIISAETSGITSVSQIITDINNLRNTITPTTNLATALFNNLESTLGTIVATNDITFTALETGNFGAVTEGNAPGSGTVRATMSGISVTGLFENVSSITAVLTIDYEGNGSSRILSLGGIVFPTEITSSFIFNGVSALSTFENSVPPTNPTAIRILSALNSSVNSDVLTLNFSNFTLGNISAPVNGVYTVIINAASALINNGQAINGANIEFSVIENSTGLDITIISNGVSGTASIEIIASEINLLNTNIAAPNLAASLITALETLSEINGTINTISFIDLNAGDFGVPEEGIIPNQGTIETNINDLTITSTGNDVTNQTAVLIINYEDVGLVRTLTIGNISLMTEDVIIEGINELSSYTNTTTLRSALAQNILVALESNSGNGLGSEILALNFVRIFNEDITGPVNGVYTIIIGPTLGSINNGLRIDGEVILTVTEGAPLVVGITSIATAGTTSVDTVRNTLNPLNNTDPSGSTGLSGQFITALESTMEVNGTITNIMFTVLAIGDFSALTGNSFIANVSGITITSDNTTIGAGVLTINYIGEGASRVLSIATNGFVFN